MERNSRRPIRHSISTDSVPSSATMKRQPNGVRPKHPLADRDHPLADRRVHDVARARCSAGSAAGAGGSGCWRRPASCPRSRSAAATRRPWRSTSRRRSPRAGCPGARSAARRRTARRAAGRPSRTRRPSRSAAPGPSPSDCPHPGARLAGTAGPAGRGPAVCGRPTWPKRRSRSSQAVGRAGLSGLPDVVGSVRGRRPRCHSSPGHRREGPAAPAGPYRIGGEFGPRPAAAGPRRRTVAGSRRRTGRD